MLQPLSRPDRYVFWSAPTDDTSDFVIEDPLAFDYLSQQVGYWLFGGLTTRTSRAQYVPVVLYGLSLVDQAVRTRALGADDEERKHLYERWERLWALSVHECRQGQFERSDDDLIRGHRGVARVWRAGSDSLPLDYKLISRQGELGGLGAYTSVLRGDANLIVPGTLRPTSLAQPIIDSFWADPGSGAKVAAYERFAELALDPDTRKVPRKYGPVTLARVGELTRLSVLVDRNRKHQQDLLWNALFERAQDDTVPFANLVRTATGMGIYEPRTILESALAGKLGSLSERQRDTLEIAMAFGDVQRTLLTCFNRAFATAFDSGWRVETSRAAAEALGGTLGSELRTACSRLLDRPLAARFEKLPQHGRDFIKLVTLLRDAAPGAALEALVHFHSRIHQERSHARPWFRLDANRLLVDVAGYGRRARAEGTFPSLKLNVVRSMLADLGRLA